MESRHLLSPNQYLYLISQTDQLSSGFNKSQDLSRISKIVNRCFNTFDIILKSKEISQDFKDKLFDSVKVNDFFRSLTKYDETNSMKDELNKQEIVRSVMNIGAKYYQEKYKPTKFISKEIEKILDLLSELDSIAKQQSDQNEALELYRLRKKMKSPPDVRQKDTYWTSMCMHCYAYTTGPCHNEDEAMRGLQHEKGCSYHKEIKVVGKKNKDKVIKRYLKIIPPMQPDYYKK